MVGRASRITPCLLNILAVSLPVVLAQEPIKPPPADAPFTAAQAGEQQRRWAKYLKQPVVINNDIGMKLTLIPPGKFLMGSPTDEEGREEDETLHPVEITRPYYLGVYEITQEEYERVMGKNPSWFAPRPKESKQNVEGLDTSRFPVEWLAIEDAEEFCRKLSELPAEKKAGRAYRLPTEAEWEYACRAGTGTPFYTGKSLSTKQANFDGLRPYYGAEKGSYLQRTTTVGSYDPNPFGLYDMAGNVWEWCADNYAAYDPSKRIDQVGERKPGLSRQLFRGGSWYFDARYSRAAERGHRAMEALSHDRCNDVGFRVVCPTVQNPPLSRVPIEHRGDAFHHR